MAADQAMIDGLTKHAATLLTLLVSGARQAIKIAFAGHADQLGDFGLEPPKVRTPLTADQKAEAAAKAKATRAANHPNAGKKGKTAPEPGGGSDTSKS
jgi:hypothetical protein